METKNDFIVIKGARENNLKNIDVRIPKGKIVVFAGASGSGKSSLVFDTIGAESMRELYNTFPAYTRNRLPYFPPADVDSIENLTMSIIMKQRTGTGDIRSTVGTLTGVSPMMRLLFSRCAEKGLPLSKAYSFNDPEGMCPVCKGRGRLLKFDLDRVFDMSKSLNEGAIRLPSFQKNSYMWQVYANSGYFDCDKPLKDFTQEEWNNLLHGDERIVNIENNTGSVWEKSYNTKYEGLLDKLERLYLKKEVTASKGTAGKILRDFTVETLCGTCGGKRLKKEALESTIEGLNIWDMGQMEISDLICLMKKLDLRLGREITEKITYVLETIEGIGLGYLNLNREAGTLSGGEAQRLNIVSCLTSALTGVSYIFDEPSKGLHPKDVERLKGLLVKLRDKGNTVLVVEHDKNVMEAADQIIELGPGAGEKGGSIVFQGTMEELYKADTLTGKWLERTGREKSRGMKKIRETRPWDEKKAFRINNCSKNNLKGFSVTIPENRLTVISGVAGAGKTTLACEELPERIEGAVIITQEPAGKTERSNPATYVGAMEAIRKLFAKENGVPAGMFSFNSKGACPVCRGRGVIESEMAFMDPVISVCEECGGTRFSREALSYKFNGRSIYQVLRMTVSEAMDFFGEYKFAEKLRALKEVGLGYITLGQATATMSGGELQRLKLASRLKSKGRVYIMDEPTTGLHGEDIQVLMDLIERIVENGNTVVAVDNEAGVLERADHIIDLGRDGGRKGGEVLFEGSVKELLERGDSYTADYMRKELTAN